jgi:hypothetical protein
MADLNALGEVISGARCWGIELDARYRVLAVTVEPDPLRVPGSAGEHQLLCFPTSVLLVAVTRPVVEDGGLRTALMTFELDQLTAVSERFAGASIDVDPFGRPEPRPGTWGPRYSLEGRSSAADGTRSTLTLDLSTEDGSRLRLFARFDDVELRDAARTVVMGTTSGIEGPAAGRSLDLGHPEESAQGSAEAGASQPDGREDPLRF